MIKKILLGMFLWLPIVYSVVFLVVSLITGTAGANWGFYFVGLSAALLVCVVLTYVYAQRSMFASRTERKSDDEPETSVSVRVSPEEDSEAAVDARDEANRFASEMKGSPSSVGGERYDAHSERSAYMAGGRYIDRSAAPDPATAPDALGGSRDALMGAEGMDSYYYGAGAQPPRSRSGNDADFSPYVQPSNYGGDGMRLSDYDDARLSRDPVPESSEPPSVPAPRIYRLRGEPNVLLYEYPTEYRKYYVNADGSLRLLSRQEKER